MGLVSINVILGTGTRLKLGDYRDRLQRDCTDPDLNSHESRPYIAIILNSNNRTVTSLELHLYFGSSQQTGLSVQLRYNDV